jgi:hypothetical protein
MFVENQDIINKPIIIDEDEVQKAYQQQIPNLACIYYILIYGGTTQIHLGI